MSTYVSKVFHMTQRTHYHVGTVLDGVETKTDDAYDTHRAMVAGIGDAMKAPTFVQIGCTDVACTVKTYCAHQTLEFNATTQWCGDCGVTLDPADTSRPAR